MVGSIPTDIMKDIHGWHFLNLIRPYTTNKHIGVLAGCHICKTNVHDYFAEYHVWSAKETACLFAQRKLKEKDFLKAKNHAIL